MKKKALATKISALLLSGVMAVSMAGCGEEGTSSGDNSGENSQLVPSDEGEGTSDNNSSGDSGSETDGESGTDSESGGTLADYEPKDLDGRTIKIGLYWDEYWDSNYQTLEDIQAAGGSYANAETMQMKLDKVREIEEKWNCRIEWVNLGWDGIVSSINTSVTAGTPDCDLYLCDPQFGIPAVLNGYAQKISTYAPADADVLNDQLVLSSYPILGSEDYMICTSDNLVIPSGATFMVYNADMLDSLNLEAPEALAARGEWTWEKFAEYALACTRDIDGDGNMDTYGYGNVWTDTVSSFLASNNAYIANSITEGLSDPKTVEVFNFLDRLYNTDGSARPYQQDWNNDQLAIFQGLVAFSVAKPYMLISQMPNIDFDVRICPLPVGPSGDGSKAQVLGVSIYFIPIGVKDASSVYMVFEELQNWFNGDTSYRDDPEWFESAFVDLEQVELAYQEGVKSNGDLWVSIDSAGAVDAVFRSVIIEKNMTVSQAIESNKQILQDKLDEIASSMEIE